MFHMVRAIKNTYFTTTHIDSAIMNAQTMEKTGKEGDDCWNSMRIEEICFEFNQINLTNSAERSFPLCLLPTFVKGFEVNLLFDSFISFTWKRKSSNWEINVITWSNVQWNLHVHKQINAFEHESTEQKLCKARGKKYIHALCKKAINISKKKAQKKRLSSYSWECKFMSIFTTYSLPFHTQMLNNLYFS